MYSLYEDSFPFTNQRFASGGRSTKSFPLTSDTQDFQGTCFPSLLPLCVIIIAAVSLLRRRQLPRLQILQGREVVQQHHEDEFQLTQGNRFPHDSRRRAGHGGGIPDPVDRRRRGRAGVELEATLAPRPNAASRQFPPQEFINDSCREVAQQKVSPSRLVSFPLTNS
jgi:hypothetical protein